MGGRIFMPGELTVACVLRTGGDYNVDYVRRLAAGVERHLAVPHRFVCLTNASSMFNAGTDIKPLRHDYPGWWAKIELFGLSGPVLYFDLDMAIVGHIDRLANAVAALDDDAIMMGRGFVRGDWQSWMMGWSGDHEWLSRVFLARVRDGRYRFGWQVASAPRLISPDAQYRGDQDWLAHMLDHYDLPVSAIQDACCVYSYKRHHVGDQLPPDAEVVCFHGRPRPHEVRPRPEWLDATWGSPCHEIQASH